MSTRHLLDPELHPLLDLMSDMTFNEGMLPSFRAARDKAVTLVDAEAKGVNRREIHISNGQDHQVRCLLYTPNQSAASANPGYVHVHGGGYIMGSPEGSDAMNVRIASKLGAVVLSVSYRLAPEHSIPAPLHDCYAGLAWLHENADTLNVDPARIAIGGESAGGGLAAATAILARDKGDFPICHQQLTYPMLDNLTGSSQQPGDPLVGEFVWTREHNQFGWGCFLGEASATAPQVPARVENYNGLPPTWMFTAGLDLFREENISYAQKLMAAGVPTELTVYPGACHGFQMLPGTKIGARYADDHLHALARGLSVQPISKPT